MIFSVLLFVIGLVFAGGAVYESRKSRDTTEYIEDQAYRVGLLSVISWTFLFASNILNLFGI